MKRTEATPLSHVFLYYPDPWLLGCVREIENAFDFLGQKEPSAGLSSGSSSCSRALRNNHPNNKTQLGIWSQFPNTEYQYVAGIL